VYVPVGVEGAAVIVKEESPKPPLMVAGLKLPVAPVGKPVTVKATLPEKPLIGETSAS
jgi:hypothetical protein